MAQAAAKKASYPEMIADLKPDERNPRTIGDEAAAGLRASLSEFGDIGGITFNLRTGKLVSGHQRVDQLKRQYGHNLRVVPPKDKSDRGYVECPNGDLFAVRFVDWPEDRARLANVAANNPHIAGEFDESLAGLLEESSESFGDLFGELRLDSLLEEFHETQTDTISTTDGVSHAISVTATPSPIEEDEDRPDDLLVDDDVPEAEFLAPFPWFGGKSRIARQVWKYFGEVQNYIEPFFGSGACLLNRPRPFDGTETVNDMDALVCNFWRAVQHDPDAVAEYADWPIIENDLHARHIWLVNNKESLRERLEGDPEYHDVKTAGWWAWGLSCWIGAEFCAGNGPWRVEEIDGIRKLVHISSQGQGVNRKRVHISSQGQGVNRKRVHIGDQGRGVNRKRVHIGDQGRGEGRGECGLQAWMNALSERLRRVRVCCGDWTRVCGGNTGDALSVFFAGGDTCAIFLDPPYADTSTRCDKLYAEESLRVAHAVREWCIRHGDDPRLRIALCGYEGEHNMPSSWNCLAWKAKGGMGLTAKGQTQAQLNAHRERVWLSPHCVKTRAADG